MADGKRYYWLKLHDDFFGSKRIKKMRRMAGGDTYLIIYLKLQLKSIRSGGVLEWTGLEEKFADELALDIDESPEDVAVTLMYLINTGLAETQDKTHLYFPYAVANTGSETAGAQRTRDWRERKASLGDTSVTQVRQIGDGEIEKEKELELEKELEPEVDSAPDPHNVFAYASSNLMALSPTHYQELASFTEDLPDDVIRHAIDEACAYNVRTWAYTKAILNNYVDNGIDTVEKAKALKEQQRGKPKSNKVGPNGVRIAAEELHDLDEVFGG